MRLVALALAIFMTWAPAALLGAPVLRYDAQAAYDFACDVMQYDATQVCVSEANGWRVGNAYLVTHNMGEFADFNWHVRYGCFQ
jgi:hypothetical protein